MSDVAARNRAEAIRRRSETLLRTSFHAERIRRLNSSPSREGEDGRYVVYWIQAAHRAMHNDALEYAVGRANLLGVPVVAVFCSTANYPEASERHVGFMYEGLCEMYESLKSRGIEMFSVACAPPEAVVAASERACEIVVDGGYLRLLRQWRTRLANSVACAVTEIEGECVVPQLSRAKARPELAAATFRPKVWPRIEAFTAIEVPKMPYGFGALDDETRRAFLQTISKFELLPLDKGVDACLDVLDSYGLTRNPNCSRVTSHVGGESKARAKLDVFLTTKMLSRYAESRNDPSLRLQSHLSPHIHYGQISVVEVARRALAFQREHAGDTRIKAGIDVFLDELIVRRELAVNFVLTNPNYDSFEGLPKWAKDTLLKHADDPREWVYTLEEFEKGQTHDKLWNASQRELVSTGKQHNYLRMYWGKKILEWSSTPEEGWKIAMALNNRYSLDGRNMVSYTGVGWCFGLHDREFFEANITGTTRRFSEAGMKKKFPVGMKAYLDRWGDEGGSGEKKRQLRMEDMFAKRAK